MSKDNLYDYYMKRANDTMSSMITQIAFATIELQKQGWVLEHRGSSVIVENEEYGKREMPVSTFSEWIQRYTNRGTIPPIEWIEKHIILNM